MKYKCLVLDHDDTVVNSTPAIHYPSFKHALKDLRPNSTPITYESFVNYCFSPGFSSLCKDILKLTPTEQSYQQKIWKSYTQSVIPDFFPGIPELLLNFKEKGGIITVVSHSEKDRIQRDYLKHCQFEPDMVFGWDLPAEQRKPSNYPLKTILETFKLQKQDLLVIDDLKPGLDMAQSLDIDFAAAGWTHEIPEIREKMKAHSSYYLNSIEEMKKIIFNLS